MKKIFAFATAAIFALSMNATVVTLNPSDFTAVTTAAAIDQTVKEIRVQITQGIINDSQIRTYKDKTLTLTAEKKISAVVFACTAAGTENYGPGNFTASVGEYSYKTTVGTWLGSAKSIVFTAGKQVRATKIEVYFDGETPTVDDWTADTINVAKARELIAAGDTHDHFVKGVVAEQPFNLFDDFKDGKVTFWLQDDLASADSLEAFQVKGLNNEKWASLEAAWEELRVGDTVLVYATSLSKYEDIFEIADGYYAAKVWSNPNPPEILLPDTINTEKALAIAKALAEPATGKTTYTKREYVVGGYAVKVWSRNSDGTWSFGMADEENGYYSFQTSNSTITAGEDTVITNEYFFTKGRIGQRKTNGNKLMYQIYKGSSWRGEPLPMEVTDVDVAHALEIGNALVLEGEATDVYAEGTYRVTGYMVSTPTGGSYDPEEGIQSFYMSDDATAERGDFLASKVTIDLEAVNGQQIAVVGRIQKHKSQSGNVSVQIYKGKATNLSRTGIENITLTEKAQKVVVDGVIYIVRDNKMFNLQGAQVR